MNNKLTFTLLGTGSSGGVPRVGNQWGKCDPDNPRNRRRRCAMLVESALPDGSKTTVLIDAGCDLREQLLAADVMHLDGVLLTHSHADHIFGLDDLRQLAIVTRSSITVHMDEATSRVVMLPFRYVFHQAQGSSYPAFCNEARIEHGVATEIEGKGGTVRAVPILAEHGDIHALGFRIDELAYLPDVKRVSDAASLAALQDLRVLILDALRYTSHPSHMNLDEALEFVDLVKPARTILTNMHSDLDYDELIRILPPTVEPGFDGMSIHY